MDSTEQSETARDASWLRGWRPLHVVSLGFIVATIVAFPVQQLVPPPFTDVALMSGVWIAFNPVARLKRSEPWWAHWGRGIVILFAFLVMQRCLR